MDISINLNAFPLWVQGTIIIVSLCTALLHGLLGIMHLCKRSGFLQIYPIHKRPIQYSPKRRKALHSSLRK